jgi:hypothetical protein
MVFKTCRALTGRWALLALAGVTSVFGQVGKQPDGPKPNPLTQAAIQGKVTDQNGNPLNHVYVSVHRIIPASPDGTPAHASGAYERTYTEPDGTYRVAAGGQGSPPADKVMLHFIAPPETRFRDEEVTYLKAWYGGDSKTVLKLSPGLILTGINQQLVYEYRITGMPERH